MGPGIQTAVASAPGGLCSLIFSHVQSKIPHKNVTNFTNDWNSGIAIAALVDALAPGLCPEAEAMDASNALGNARHAMTLAEQWLEVPQVSTQLTVIIPVLLHSLSTCLLILLTPTLFWTSRGL